MVQQDERRAARAWALMEMHHAGSAERALERVALEPIVEQLPDRHRGKAHQVHHALFPEAVHTPRSGHEASGAAQAGLHGIGWRRLVEPLE